MPRPATAIPLERFFVRGQKPEAVIKQLKAEAKAAGQDPKALQVAVGRTRVPLAKIEKDLPAMWRDVFDPGPLGRGQAFRPQFEKDFRDPSIMRLSERSHLRLGKLSDEAVREITFTRPERLAKLDLAHAKPELVLFLARSVELETANATWAGPALRHLLAQPLDFAALPPRSPAEQSAMLEALKRGAVAVGIDPASLPARDQRTGKVFSLPDLVAVLKKREHDDPIERERMNNSVYGADGVFGYDYDAGPMPFDYATAPGYGGGTGMMPGYDNVPRDVRPAPVAPSQPIRVAPPPPDVRLPPRVAPAPPDVRLPPRPPPASGGVVFTPPPPEPPPAIGRPLRSTPWEIIATPGASNFFEAKAKGWDGSWEDWKAR